VHCLPSLVAPYDVASTCNVCQAVPPTSRPAKKATPSSSSTVATMPSLLVRPSRAPTTLATPMAWAVGIGRLPAPVPVMSRREKRWQSAQLPYL